MTPFTWPSADQLKGQVGRKVLVLITDGEDEGSRYKISQAIEAAQKADAIIYGFLLRGSRILHVAAA